MEGYKIENNKIPQYRQGNIKELFLKFKNREPTKEEYDKYQGLIDTKDLSYDGLVLILMCENKNENTND